ncbi:MAG TPA: adenylate kinase [Solirubrobacteraceae bacterium]|jgi:adenylate kinase
MSELNLILLGPPGAGKGTQAALLTEDFGLPHIATGDILRAAREAQTELGLLAKKYMDAGELVPDEVVIGVILERIGSDDARDGFLLDGFPRTIEQADALGVRLEAGERRLTATLLLDAPDDLVVARISGRRLCRKQGHVYHVDFDPPKNDGRCDIDGSELDQRDDDREETVRNRLAVYHAQTEPLIAYYDELGLLCRFDGTRPPSDVHDHIRATLATLRLEEDL